MVALALLGPVFAQRAARRAPPARALRASGPRAPWPRAAAALRAAFHAAARGLFMLASARVRCAAIARHCPKINATAQPDGVKGKTLDTIPLSQYNYFAGHVPPAFAGLTSVGGQKTYSLR